MIKNGCVLVIGTRAHQGKEELPEEDGNEWFWRVADEVCQQETLGSVQWLNHYLTMGEMVKGVS